jgi:hypothetical protein
VGALSEPDVELQDTGVPAGPRIRVRGLLALLRIVAGHEGLAHLTWWGQGFRYDLTVHREGPTLYHLDRAPDAWGGADAAALIRRAIGDA